MSKGVIVAAGIAAGAAMIMLQQPPQTAPSPATSLLADCERQVSKLERRYAMSDSAFERVGLSVEIDQTRSMCEILKRNQRAAPDAAQEQVDALERARRLAEAGRPIQ